MKNSLGYKMTICILICILSFINTMFIADSKVEATAEEGIFEPNEWKYNIKFTKVASCHDSTCMIDEDGRLWRNTYEDVGEFGLKQIFTDYRFSDIAAGKEHLLLLDQEGYLYACGHNYYYELGNGTNQDTASLVAIYATKQFKSIACGDYSSYAIDTNDNLYAWGSNKCRQTATTLYIQDDERFYDDINIPAAATPQKILKDIKFEKVSAGGNSVIALDKDGYVWGWGENYYGQVGNYASNTIIEYDYQNTVSNTTQTLTYRCITTPTKISESILFKDIAMGGNHSILLTQNGKVYTIGDNTNGALGNGKTSGSTTSLTIPIGMEDIIVEKILSGDKMSAFMDENHNIWTCGDNTNGVLGNGTTTNSATVVKVKTDSGVEFIDFAVSDVNENVFVFDTDGELWGWGINGLYDGQVCVSGRGNVTSPIQITDKRDIFTVTFKNGENIVKTETVEQGNSATAPSLTKLGYTLSWDVEFSNITSDLTVNAIWTANTNTGYKVEHYLRSTDMEVESYILYETENKTGTTDALAVAIAKSYTGFTENDDYTGRVASGNVEGDGTLVLKLYYDRNTYSVTLNTNGGTINSGDVTSYTYGITKTLPTNVTKTGYIFGGWYSNRSFTGTKVTSISNTEAENKTYYARWISDTDTEYKVEHYKQIINLDGYELVETENLAGETDDLVTATAKTYEGFIENTNHAGRVVTGTVAGDGSLVLKLYYDRNTYSVTLNTNGGTINSGDVTSYTYGKTKTLPTNVTKTGYTFAGWFDNEELTGKAVTAIEPTELGDKEYFAKWTQNQFTVTFKNGTETVKTQTVTYGEDATAPELTKTGYTLSWDKDFSNITSDLIVNAVWTANTNTAYKVEHYKRNLDTEVEGYNLFETEELTGTTDTLVTAIAKTYEGFTENTSYSGRVESGTIAGDGSLVLKLYYNRNKYSINYELNGGEVTNTLTDSYIYGKGLILSNKVIKNGCVFLGWYNNQELTGETITQIGTEEIGNKTFYAKWSTEENYYITSEKYSVNMEEKYLTKVSPNTNVTTFKKSLATNGTVKVLNLKGEEVLDDSLVGTGYKVQIEHEGTTYEYEIAVRADLDGNGKVTVTDLSMLNQALVKKLTLSGIKEKAADIDYSGKMTVTDLSMMNQAIVGKLSL